MSLRIRLHILGIAAAVSLAGWCAPGGAYPSVEGFGRDATEAELRSRGGAPKATTKPAKAPAATETLSALFLAATGAEYDWLISQLDKAKTTAIHGVEVTSGTMGGRRVAVVETGIGRDQALPRAKTVLNKLKPRVVISTGVAGSLSPAVSLGDVVVGASCGAFSERGARFSSADYKVADLGLLKRCQALIKQTNQVSPKQGERKVVLGRIATGNEAITTESAAAEIRAALKSIAADSEAADLATLCGAKKIPFIAIRGISHRANANAAAEFARFGDSAAEASARVAAALIE